MARVSVIILTHNKWPYTAACLESLAATDGVELDVVVVDNGSTDETPRRLAELTPRFQERGHDFRRLLNPSNVGCSTGRNQGLEAARGDYCAFMDNDVMAAAPDWALKHLAVLEGEGPALVGPKLVYPFRPHLIQCAGVGISRSGRVQFRGRGRPRDAAAHELATRAAGVLGRCVLGWLVGRRGRGAPDRHRGVRSLGPAAGVRRREPGRSRRDAGGLVDRSRVGASSVVDRK